VIQWYVLDKSWFLSLYLIFVEAEIYFHTSTNIFFYKGAWGWDFGILVSSIFTLFYILTSVDDLRVIPIKSVGVIRFLRPLDHQYNIFHTLYNISNPPMILSWLLPDPSYRNIGCLRTAPAEILDFQDPLRK